MKILVLGGITKKYNAFEGGYLIAQLIGQYSHHEVHLYTNFSSEEMEMTNQLKERLYHYNVDTTYSSKVSVPFNTGTSSGTNDFSIISQKPNLSKHLSSYDYLIISTDATKADIQKVLNVSQAYLIPTTVFNINDYSSINTTPNLIDEVIITNNNVYEVTKKILIEKDLIEKHTVKRTEENKPDTHHFKFLKVLTKLSIFGIILFTIFIMTFIGFDKFDGPRPDYDLNINFNAPIDHESCQTVGQCIEYGDDLLTRISSYVDLLDEPHIYVENRSKVKYATFNIQNFELVNNDLIADLPINDIEYYTDIWEKFVYIIPNEHIQNIDTFELFSDGEGNTLAYVDINRGGTKLGIDIRDNASRGAKYRTLLHEFGHIYSLPITDFNEECHSTDISCLKEDAVLNQFLNRFWKQYGQNWYENKYKSTPEQQAFYNNNINDFFVPYQALNVKEDYAITFMTFITHPYNDDATTLKNIKVRSFYEDSKLVELRVDILKNILKYEKENL